MKPSGITKIRVFKVDKNTYMYCDCSDLCDTASFAICSSPNRILAIHKDNNR